MEERKDKKGLLGSMGKIHATYDYHVPIEELKKPLDPGMAIRCFCQGCGTVFGIDFEEALVMKSIIPFNQGVETESFVGFYFYISVCNFCDGDKFFIELRPIPKN